MDPVHRWTIVGLCAMAAVWVAPKIDLPLHLLNRHNHDSHAPEQGSQRGQELMLDRTFDVRSGGTLAVDVPDGDVEIRAGSDSRATVRVYVSARDMGWGREVFDRMEFAVAASADRVTVRARSPRIHSDEWRANQGVGVKVELTVPRDFNADISTSDGDIDMGSLDGRVELHSSDGDIHFGTLRGPHVTIATSDGDVVGEMLAAERVTLETSDGDVDVTMAAGTARISTSDGDIQLHLVNPAEVDLSTGDGDITIFADPSLRADVELRGEDVHMASPFKLEGRIMRGGATGTLNGGGPLLVAETGDGSISIRNR
ncbi:MAG: DUF4097 family beta strand repeat protein [Gemmatimonadota bacterium]|nr:MAG: DUF4097 family beta strand repeat protein [Gemmatimonadota bacterium]